MCVTGAPADLVVAVGNGRQAEQFKGESKAPERELFFEIFKRWVFQGDFFMPSD
jgi:RecA/RadA recombinase